VSTFDDPSSVKLGSAAVVEEMMVGEDRMVHFSGCALNEACTIVLRGASERAAALGLCCAAPGRGWAAAPPERLLCLVVPVVLFIRGVQRLGS
jgi:hypothetical protein